MISRQLLAEEIDVEASQEADESADASLGSDTVHVVPVPLDPLPDDASVDPGLPQPHADQVVRPGDQVVAILEPGLEDGLRRALLG